MMHSTESHPDHPRSRGVYARPPRAEAVARGSSPLARGLRPAAPCGGRSAGIIPARAGFTTCARADSLRSSDHPRSRGVYSRCTPRTARRSGSSPLARGLQVLRSHPYPGKRIIPARAGFTHFDFPSGSCALDHPRSRGVYSPIGAITRACVGSSPLARGLPPTRVYYSRIHRIIPARAGFTRAHRSRGGHLQDHPRSRGVYYRPLASVFNRLGSSPLARGLRHRRR